MDFYLQKLHSNIASELDTLTADELTACPDGKWSPGQILEHLYLTYSGTIRGLERCLASGAPLARVPGFRDRVTTFVVVRCGYLPEGRQAPKQAQPRGLCGEQVRSEILGKIVDMDALLQQAQQKYGTSTRLMDHPILGPLRGWEWCKFHFVHGQLHLRQIRQRRDAARSLASPTIS